MFILIRGVGNPHGKGESGGSPQTAGGYIKKSPSSMRGSGELGYNFLRITSIYDKLVFT
jgi:hypothetical protein